jgi:hypothetical protein
MVMIVQKIVLWINQFLMSCFLAAQDKLSYLCCRVAFLVRNTRCRAYYVAQVNVGP